MLNAFPVKTTQGFWLGALLMVLACSDRRGGGGGDGDGPDNPFGGSGDETTEGSSGQDPGATSGSVSGSAAEVCVATINDYRDSLGLSPYQRWSDAEGCSDDEAASDASTQTPHGAFGQCGEWAQNECPGWTGAPEQMIVECLAAMWSEGPGGGHYEAMRSGEYSAVACGFHVTGSGEVWAVQNFK